jgi:glycerol 3-phosphatase-2
VNATTTESNAYLLGSETPLCRSFDAALFDLDGVVYRGPFPVERAPEAIAAARAAGMRTVFVTNNANREPGTVADHLSQIGVPAEVSDVLTSSQVAAVLLGERLERGSRVLAVGGVGLRTALLDAGFTLVDGADESPDAVVQGFAPSVGWTQLAEAGYAIRAGALYVATNLDLTIPTDRGIAPGNGTLVGVVVAATGVTPVAAGKPEPAMFLQAAARAAAVRPLVVGDRLDTDLAGAVAADQAGLLVLTGVSGPREAVLAAPKERPRFIALDLDGLLVPHPAPRRLAVGEWACRGARVRIDGSHVVEVAEGDGASVRWDGSRGAARPVEITLDALRALCCAAWERADAGQPLHEVPDVRVTAGVSAAG